MSAMRRTPLDPSCSCIWNWTFEEYDYRAAIHGRFIVEEDDGCKVHGPTQKERILLACEAMISLCEEVENETR